MLYRSLTQLEYSKLFSSQTLFVQAQANAPVQRATFVESSGATATVNVTEEVTNVHGFKVGTHQVRRDQIVVRK